MRPVQLTIRAADAAMVDTMLRDLAPRAQVRRSPGRGGEVTLRILGAAPFVTDYIARHIVELSRARERLEALWRLEVSPASLPPAER